LYGTAGLVGTAAARYFWAGLEAWARDRAAGGHPGRPLLVVWEDLATAWGDRDGASVTRLLTGLTAGGIQVVGVDTDLRRLTPAQRAAVLAAPLTWWIGHLPADAAGDLEASLRALGGGAILPPSLPAGLALLRVPQPTGAFLCTVQALI